jgi:hypothetical protein
MTPLERWLYEHVPPYSWHLPAWQEDSIEIAMLCIILFGVSAGAFALASKVRQWWKR